MLSSEPHAVFFQVGETGDCSCDSPGRPCRDCPAAAHPPAGPLQGHRCLDPKPGTFPGLQAPVPLYQDVKDRYRELLFDFETECQLFKGPA